MEINGPAEFVKLWHRALAAGTANSIHLDGPGRFYIAGPNADFVDIRVLGGYMQDMVKMSPLQGSYFQIVPTSHDMARDRRGGGEPGEVEQPVGMQPWAMSDVLCDILQISATVTRERFEFYAPNCC